MNLKKSIEIGLARKSITNKKLANDLGISTTTITELKRKNSTTASTLQRLADYFDVPVSKFIEWGE